jgi:adenylate cyclase
MTDAERTRLRRRLLLAGNGINFVGAALVTLYVVFVFPPPEGETRLLGELSGVLLALVVFTASAVVAVRRSHARLERVEDELDRGGPPHAVLRFPRECGRISVDCWLACGTLVAGVVALDGAPGFAVELFVTVLLAGLTTATANFLAVERIMRPFTARALGAAAPPEAGSLGIGPRLLLTWLLCSGVPILGVALVPVGRTVQEPGDLVAPIWFVAAIAFVAGLIGMKLATHAVAAPIRELRRAVDAVGAGDLATTVRVDDGSEVGRLQAGFNAMVEGLRERARLRDLYGRQVGEAVMREALDSGAALGGREQPVSALFVDVIGSTTLSLRESPERVIGLLNAFFGVVVEVTERHGGIVNKFEGDAALCVFGAPAAEADHEARCLAAAREIQERLCALEPQVRAAVGVASGPAVVGYVGAESRFEWTVIGDPINQAARLTELAKTHPARLLVAAETVAAARAPGWEPQGEAVLRGRDAPTAYAAPAARLPSAA